MLLYIDPGTGGMLFSIIFSLLGIVYYFFRMLVIKIKYGFGKKRDASVGEKDEIVIFTDHKRYWNVFEPILDEFEKRERYVKYLTMSEDDPVFKSDYKYVTGEYIGTGNKAFSRLNMLNAKIVLSTTPSLDVFQWKRSRGVDYYIHIPHAASDITLYRMFGIDYYDAILLSGEYQEKQIRHLEHMRHLKEKDIEIVGIPYMDVMKERLDKTAQPENTGGKTVLIAPSWGSSSLLNVYGNTLIDAVVGAGYKVILRPHPQSYTAEKDMIDKLYNEYKDNPKVEWNRDNDNFDILNRADIMISDFSGVIFDFTLVYDKPVIYTDTQFDVSPYDAWWSDDELWTYKVLPKLGVKLDSERIEDIKSVIDLVISDNKFQKGRDMARSECWEYMGKGTERTVDYLMKKHDELCAVRREA